MSICKPDYLLRSPRPARRLHGAALKSHQARRRRERRVYLGMLALYCIPTAYGIHEHIAVNNLQDRFDSRVVADAEDLVDAVVQRDGRIVSR